MSQAISLDRCQKSVGDSLRRNDLCKASKLSPPYPRYVLTARRPTITLQWRNLTFFFFLNFKIFNSYMRSQTWTPLLPPSPQHLSGSSPCNSPKHAAPYIRHGLAIQFLHDSIHVTIPSSQIIPPSPSPSESKSLVYTSVSFFLSCIQGRHCHLPKFHIYVLVYCKCLGSKMKSQFYNC